MNIKTLKEKILNDYAKYKSNLILPNYTNDKKVMFSTSEFLFNLDLRQINKSEMLIIEKFCKHIDVNKSVMQLYNSTFVKPVTELPLDRAFIGLLIIQFSYLAVVNADYKLLNSLLKMKSGILSFKLEETQDSLISCVQNYLLS